MKEIFDIINAFNKARSAGQQSALATVVQVEGSSYRRPGARMLITEDGRLTGGISGGCLEGDALQKARLAMMNKTSMVVSYDSMDEDEAIPGMGLGCNGIIHVLIEPIDINDPFNPIAFLKKATAQRDTAVLTTLFSLASKREHQPGTCLLTRKNETFGSRSHPLYDVLVKDAHQVLSSKQSLFRNYITGGTTQSAFIEYLKPPVSLVIAGAGNDVIPLVAMASILGWNTTVIDGRPALAKKERFASSCNVMVAKPEAMFEKLDIDEYTVFVLMTHNYHYDLAVLRCLLVRDVTYIGILGPRKKMERMLDDLSKQGITPDDRMLQRLHSPVGLDIGATNPEEIALSIVSEIKAALSGRQGLSLHTNSGSIHARDEWVNISIDPGEY